MSKEIRLLKANPASTDPLVQLLAQNGGDMELAIETLSPHKGYNLPSGNAQVDIRGRIVKAHLNDTQITDEALLYLAEMEDLIVLFVGGSQITDRGLQMISRKLSKLEEIHIGACPNLTDAGVNSLTNLANLKMVWVYGNDNITESSIENLKKQFPSLVFQWHAWQPKKK